MKQAALDRLNAHRCEPFHQDCTQQGVIGALCCSTGSVPLPGFYLGTSFLGGKMVRGKCALGRGLEPSPQESVSVPLCEHIYSSVSTGRQELSLNHYFKLHLGKPLGRKLECLGEKLPPPHPPSTLIARLTSLVWSDQWQALATNLNVSTHSCQVSPSPSLFSPEKLGMGGNC